MHILVTGGAGFIGSHLAEALVRRGHRVRILDNFYAGERKNLKAIAGDVEVLRGDSSDPRAARKAVKGVEVVYHEAAVPSVARSVDEPALSHRHNATATLSMLEAARDAGVKRVVFAGSSSVYGDAAVLPKREDMKPSPLSPYALQKLIGEQYCQMFTRLYGLETVTTRFFNVFGPRQQPGSPYSGVISLFIEALASGKSPTVHGDGKQTRDFTFVGDVVTGVLQACEAPNASGEVINVATNRRISLNELLATLNKIFGTNLEPIYREARQGDVKDSLADISKAERLLGYKPIVGLEDGLRATVKWFTEA